MANYINNTQGFTQVPNATITNNKGLSLKAKGLWLYLASKPSGWHFSAERISNENQDGRDSVRAGLQELERAGLLIRTTKSNGYKKFETIYEIVDAKFDDGKIDDEKIDDEKIDVENPVIISNKYISNKELSNKYIKTHAPAKPVRGREIPQEAYQLAERLYKWIKKNKPDRKIQDGWKNRWAIDIEKMHRIDGRDWRRIAGAIDWSQADDFWHQNVLSGANLRKHYDRIEERAIQEMESNGSQAMASAIFNQTPEQAIENARAQGLI